MNYILTAQGRDEKGLVEKLARKIEELGGNWLDSKLCRLGGQFAGIVRAEFPAQPSELPRVVGTLTCHWQADDSSVAGLTAESSPVRLSILAADRPGIVRQISEILRSHDTNVEEFESRVESAPFSGEPMFRAEYTVRFGSGTVQEMLRESLEGLAEELMCDLDLGDAPDLVSAR